jgi:hypothetical protein
MVRQQSAKKTDVAERPKAFHHVGLLVNEPFAGANCSLDSHPKTSTRKLVAAPEGLQSIALLMQLYAVVGQTQGHSTLVHTLVGCS